MLAPTSAVRTVSTPPTNAGFPSRIGFLARNGPIRASKASPLTPPTQTPSTLLQEPTRISGRPRTAQFSARKTGGKTWARTVLPYKNGGNEDGRSIGERLMVDPNNGKILFFGSRNNGLWRSNDAGITWEQVTSFPITAKTNGIGIGFVLFDEKSDKHGTATPTIYAGVDSPGVASLYRSLDAGKTWAAVAGYPENLLPHHAALDRDGTLYVTYGNNPGPNGVTDGAVWKLDTKQGGWIEISPVKTRQWR